jgi:Fur family ferric uptake transcriptional regulator
MTAFLEQGLVMPCDFGDGLTRYEWNHQHHAHHHHIICQRCRKVEELEHCVVQELENLVSKRGYQQVSHRLEFYGICQDCAEAAR